MKIQPTAHQMSESSVNNKPRTAFESKVST